MKILLILFLMACMAITSAVSLTSCKKEASPIADIQALPDQDDENRCPICNRHLIHTLGSMPLSPQAKTTPYSCYHEYQAGESCPYDFCNLYPEHHYHFFYVKDEANGRSWHIGGGFF